MSWFSPLLALSVMSIMGPESRLYSPEYKKWQACIDTGSDALSHGPDAADLVARAVMAECRAEEYYMRDPYHSFADFWDKEHAKMQEYAMVRVIHHRAMRKVGIQE